MRSAIFFSPSLRRYTARLPHRAACGVAMRGGCAALHLCDQLNLPFLLLLLFRQHHPMMNVPLTLPKLSSRSPIRFRFPDASLRDRASLPSPLRGLDPSGGYPSRLRSLRSLRGPLARRFASLTAVCRYVAVVQCTGIPVQPCPPLPRLPSPAAPALGCASASRHPHSRTPPSVLPRRVSTAHPPRRLPFGSTSGTLHPSFCTLDWALSTPFGGSALTPHAAGCPERQHHALVRSTHRPLRSQPTPTVTSMLGGAYIAPLFHLKTLICIQK